VTGGPPSTLRAVPGPSGAQRILSLLGIGIAAGLGSGLFGVGGALLVVPGLVILLRYPQRIAVGSSMLAVWPTSIIGIVSYTAQGGVDWFVAGVLAAAVVAGGVLGSWLLARLPVTVITWLFITLLLVAAVRLALAPPEEHRQIVIDLPHLLGLLGIGVGVGMLSGVTGAGAGVAIVPLLVLLFGMDPFVAKGVSLVAVVPNGITTSLLNLRRGLADLRASAWIFTGGAPAVIAGSLLSGLMTGQVGPLLFAGFLVAIAAYFAVRLLRRGRAPSPRSLGSGDSAESGTNPPESS